MSAPPPPPNLASRPSFDPDAKEEIEYVEAFDNQVPGVTAQKSQLDNLTIPQAARAFWKASLFCFFAAFSALPDGYQINLAGSIIVNKGFVKQFGAVNPTTGVSALKSTWIASWGGFQSMGQILGMLSLNFFADRFGRKKALYLLWVVLVGSIFAETFAAAWWAWLIAKLLAGAGVGMLQATVPVYITELAPNQLRGALVNLYSLWFCFGQFLAPLTLRELALHSPLNYKTPIYTQWGFLAVMMAIYVFLPESPWWLASTGKVTEARAVLQRVNGGVEGYDVERELNIVLEVIYKQRREAALLKNQGWLPIFKGENGWRTLIATWPKCMQQLTGLTLVNTYAALFFSYAGNKDPFLVTTILAATQIASVILMALVSDRWGRRFITVVGFGITAVSVLAIGILGCFDYTRPSLASVLIFLACLCIFFNTAAGAIGYVYLSEVPTQRWRARTAGFGAAIAACFGLIFSTCVPLMLKGSANWGVKTGFFFAATGIPAVVLAFFILPETAQRSAAEMDELFADKISPRHFKGHLTRVQMESNTVQAQTEAEIRKMGGADA